MKRALNIILVILLIVLVAYLGYTHVQERIEAEKIAIANSIRAQMSTPEPSPTPTPTMTQLPTQIPVPSISTLQEALNSTIVEDAKGIYHIVFKNIEGVEFLDYPVENVPDSFFFVMKSGKLVCQYYHGDIKNKVYKEGTAPSLKNIAKCFCRDGEVQKANLLLGYLNGTVASYDFINFEVKIGRIREGDGTYTYGLVLCGGHSKKPSGDGGSGGSVEAPPTQGPTHEPTPTPRPTQGPTHEPTPTPRPTQEPTHEPIPTPGPTQAPPVHEATLPPKQEIVPVHEATLPPK